MEVVELVQISDSALLALLEMLLYAAEMLRAIRIRSPQQLAISSSLNVAFSHLIQEGKLLVIGEQAAR